MSEREIIRSVSYTGKVITTILVVLGILLSCIAIYTTFSNYCEYYHDHEHGRWCYISGSDNQKVLNCSYSRYGSAEEYAIENTLEDAIRILIVFVVAPLIFGFILRLLLRSFRLVVTDKRIYGWHNLMLWRTDLSLDMVTSVSLIGFTGISVRTAAGRITFWLVKNRLEVHKAICELLIQRQSPRVEIPESNPAPMGIVDES